MRWNPSAARTAPAVAVVLFCAACSGDDPQGGVRPGLTDTGDTAGGARDVEGSDGDTGGSDPNDTRDTSSRPDLDGEDRLGLGEICLNDGECESVLCFVFDPTIEEGFCTQFCLDDSSCGAGDYRCVFLQNSGGDFARICVPPNLCIDRDEDGYGLGPGCRGPDCDDTRADINPGELERCDGIDNNCNGNIDENPADANQSCDSGFPGLCADGITRCFNGLLVCEAERTARPEICDGLDNNCDGTIDRDDEGNPLRVDCYGGASVTRDVGICRGGLRTCTEGILGDCDGQVLPSLEVCDGLDNDCDGIIDEGSPGAGQPCDVPDARGVCSRGRTQCDATGGLVCAQTVTPSAEVCDGLDNDCDGTIDLDAEGEPLERICYGGPAETRGVGLCRDGIQICQESQFGDCLGAVLPAAEICDGLDNDCDGAIDEGGAAGGFVCSTGQLGVCAVGTTTCTDDGSICQRNLDPSPEICDGLDNDCDGAIDEGPDGLPLRRACYTGLPASTEGVGACRGGEQVCGADGFGRCIDEVRPSPEICDGIDNDCDGQIDEGNPGGDVACSTGLAGVCSAGVTACTSGAVVCTQTVFPSAEVCDGFDNDCNGQTDEAPDGRPLTLACYDGPAGTSGRGQCSAGVRTCAGGAFGSCVGQVLPGTEVCDGIDNNCDGTIDSGNPGGGISCNTGESGVCAAGQTACSAGGIICQRLTAPQTEICDGIDNDCDGRIDEGFPGLGEPCFAGLGICQNPGVRVCASNPSAPPVCNAVPRTGNPVELCDYVDDNCNGAVDEGFVDAQGRYITLANCGACGFDCNQRWIGGPALYNVQPTCTPTATSATCGFTCLAGWVDADGIADNGCELRPENDTVYVATPSNGGSDESGCGAWDRPCASIQGAIDLAGTSGRVRVRVSSGLYRENITLRNGVSVLGGHSHINWTRNPDIFGTTIRGNDTGSGADRVVVQAIGITSGSSGGPTELSGFSIVGVTAAPGGNSIGIHVVNSNQNLRITNNEITAGNGGAGTTGTAGSSGVSGVAGSPGRTSENANRTSTTYQIAGGDGGARSCGGTTVNGGRGGNGLNPTAAATTSAQPSGPGVAGSGPAGGAGGRAGIHMWNNGGLCQVPGPTDGSPGLAGSPGGDGSRGTRAASNGGTVATGSSQWRGATGTAGAGGAPGSGGGGGGSSGGFYNGSGTQNHVPPSGGGGGAGGCPGTGGGAGSAGGGSFGVLLAYTATGPTAASQMPVINANRIRRGLGGRGGDGGTGGGGGEGGAGAAGGTVNSAGVAALCLVDASPGGTGGRGGHGGGGSGGTGGVSWDIYAARTNGHNPGYGTNTFEIAAGVATSGAGGTGGNSSNTAVGTGENGLAGLSGQLSLNP